jgi:hypothetical protein
MSRYLYIGNEITYLPLLFIETAVVNTELVRISVCLELLEAAMGAQPY